jgi:hypothetical protein
MVDGLGEFCARVVGAPPLDVVHIQERVGACEYLGYIRRRDGVVEFVAVRASPSCRHCEDVDGVGMTRVVITYQDRYRFGTIGWQVEPRLLLARIHVQVFRNRYPAHIGARPDEAPIGKYLKMPVPISRIPVVRKGAESKLPILWVGNVQLSC